MISYVDVTVYGHTRSEPCKYIKARFLCDDEIEFWMRVQKWAEENDVIEWHRTNTGRV